MKTFYEFLRESTVELNYFGGSKKLHQKLLKEIASLSIVKATKVDIKWAGNYVAVFNSQIELKLVMSNDGKTVEVICDDSGVIESVTDLLHANKTVKVVRGGNEEY